MWGNYMMFSVYDALPSGIIVLDSDQYIVFWNRQLEIWSGVSRIAASGKRLSDLYPNADAHALRQAIQAVFAHDEIFLDNTAEQWFSFSLANGQPRPLRLSAQRYATEGQFYAVLTLNDASAERHLQGVYLHDMAEFRALFNLLDALLFINDYDGRYIKIYETNMMLSSLAPSQTYVGKRFADIFPSDVADFFLTNVRQVIDEQRERIIEYDLQIGDETRWFNAKLAPYQSDKVISLVRDITDRKRAELAQKAEHEFALQVMQALGQGVTVMSDRGYEFANPAFCDMVGYPVSQIIGRPMMNFIAPEEYTTIYAMLYKMRKSERETFETRLRRADGSYIDALMTFSHHLRDGEKHGIISVITDLIEIKAAQRKITESEAELRALFASIPDTVMVLDGAGRYLNIPETAIPFHRPIHELIGKTIHEAWDDVETADYLLSEIQAAIKNGEMRHLEFQFSINGHQHWFEANVAPTGDNRVVSVVRNVTARKRAEEQIRQSESQLRSILLAIPDVVVVLDKDGRYLDLPSRVTPLYRPKEELIGKHVQDVWDADIARQTMAMLKQVIETDQPHSFEYKLTINGRRHWFLASLAPRQDKKSVVAIIRTITSLKEAVQKLAESESELKALFAAMTDYIFVVNEEGRFLRILDTAAAIKIPEVVRSGRTIHDVLDEGIADMALINIRRALQTGQPSQLEFSLQVGGSTRWYYAQAAALDNKRALVVMRDISDRVIAQQKVLELTVEREKGQLLAEFVHSASHDFRTPLSTINTSIYILSKSDKPESRERQLNVLRNQVRHLERLVDGLFTMSRLEMVTTFHFIPTRITDILQYIAVNLRAIIEEKGLRLHITHADNLPLVLGDEGELTRALRCLLDNAITFTPSGMIEIRAEQEDQHVLVMVSDSGVGIAPEDLPHIFDRFFKADRARTAPTGLGVGLTIAKRIVELHRGVIEVASELGKGTTFTIRLPFISPQ